MRRLLPQGDHHLNERRDVLPRKPPGTRLGLVTVMSVALTVVSGAQNAGWRAKPEIVAKAAAGQPGFNYDEARVAPYTLPDPLATAGPRVTSARDWPARRTAILELFRKTVYGRSPGRPERLVFKTVEENARAMDGAATLKRIAISVGHDSRTLEFDLTLFLPNARSGRVPVFLLINNRPVSNTDPTRKERSPFWPAEEVISRGYGIAAIQNGQLAPDNKDRYREGVIALFDPPAGNAGTKSPYTWKAIAAWAWGASRALDYFQTDARVDAARVAVVGHSRGGKAALWAGVEDERFAMVVSNESGEGGAALSRRSFGETVQRINEVFPHWFVDTYRTFGGREAELPVDQHMLLSLIAPRALYVASADEDLWADPRGEFLALAASSPVYGLFGEPPIESSQMPPIDSPLVVSRRAYHVRTGGHNLTSYDWARFVDFADRVFSTPAAGK